MRRALLLLAASTTAACGSGGGSTTSGDTPDAGTCSLSAPALPDTRLHADGTRLRDALGRVVILRGVNAGGRSKFTPFVPFDFAEGGFDAALAAYLDRAEAWGLDALRVPFTWAAVEPVQGMDDDAYLARYDALLDGAWKRGMYTIVDFHQDIYAEVFCGDGFPAWTVPDPKPAPHHDCPSWSTAYFNDDGVKAAFDAFWASGSPVQAAYASMWDRMAARYKDRPGVIGFELLNEPGWGTQNLDQFEATTLTDFFSTMIARVQKTAPSSLVFFDATGPDAGVAATSLKRPTGEGIVFAPHYYQLSALGGISGDPARVRLDLAKWQNQARQWDVPVLLGEFGIVNTAAEPAAFMTAHFDALDALGMHGTQWEYSVAKEDWNSEDLSLVRADGTENAMAAAIVRAYPRAVAGDDVAFAFDAATGGFTLSYTPAAGITEVAVPARLYPAGYDVKISGGCADTGTAGRLLVQAEGGATKVEVTVTAR
ncbi:MAG: cellulase family glycosylhydrolase [Minicystis sp.]